MSLFPWTGVIENYLSNNNPPNITFFLTKFWKVKNEKLECWKLCFQAKDLKQKLQFKILRTATFTFSAGNGVEDLETDVIHLLAKTSNFLLVLNSSINFVIYLSIDTKCAIKIIIIVVVIFINLCLNCLWYIQVSSSCSWDVWSVCVSPSHTHPSLHPKVYIMIWSSSWPSSRPSSSWPWPWWSSSSY